MKMVAITAPSRIKFETDTINRLFREGLDELHIHKPQYDKEAMRTFIGKIDPEFHEKLVLHSNYELIHEFDISRIHLSRHWMSNLFTNFYLEKVILKGKSVIKSKTVTNCEDLYAENYGIDELVLGPIFGKTMYYVDKLEFKSSDIEAALKHCSKPVTAMGGVHPQNIEFFENMGFTSLALQSGIWKTPDPVSAFIEIRDLCHSSAQMAA